jgi:hypothetical protein
MKDLSLIALLLAALLVPIAIFTAILHLKLVFARWRFRSCRKQRRPLRSCS